LCIAPDLISVSAQTLEELDHAALQQTKSARSNKHSRGIYDVTEAALDKSMHRDAATTSNNSLVLLVSVHDPDEAHTSEIASLKSGSKSGRLGKRKRADTVHCSTTPASIALILRQVTAFRQRIDAWLARAAATSVSLLAFH
jgi:hypothetical protein